MCRMLPLGLLLCAAAALLAADQPADKKAEAIQLIDKAIEVLGGEERTLALQARQGKAKGKVYVLGIPVPYDAEYAFHFPDRWSLRTTTNDLIGTKIARTIVYNKGQAWEITGKDLKETKKEHAEEIGHFVYYVWLHQLTQLKKAEFSLQALGPSKIDDVAVHGVKVSCKGRRDTQLFFDEKTHHLIASETTAMNEERKTVPFAARIGGYVKVDGVGYYTTIKVSRNGKPYFEETLLEQKRLPSLPDKMFKKP